VVTSTIVEESIMQLDEASATLESFRQSFPTITMLDGVNAIRIEPGPPQVITVVVQNNETARSVESLLLRL
jgi:hypothetical protein